MENVDKCWICGAREMSGEHMTKRSDLKSALGTPTLASPFFFHDAKTKNRRIISLDAALLKRGRICVVCNSSRSQPHDRAWEKLSRVLRLRTPPVLPGAAIRANRIFPHNTAKEMLNVHLYFVKLFGCYIKMSGVPIDLDKFASALLNKKAHPGVYLKFGSAADLEERPTVGITDLDALNQSDGSCAFAQWFYFVGRLAVHVMFAKENEQRQGLVDAWHPKFGTNRLVFAIFEWEDE